MAAISKISNVENFFSIQFCETAHGQPLRGQELHVPLLPKDVQDQRPVQETHEGSQS